MAVGWSKATPVGCAVVFRAVKSVGVLRPGFTSLTSEGDLPEVEALVWISYEVVRHVKVAIVTPFLSPAVCNYNTPLGVVITHCHHSMTSKNTFVPGWHRHSTTTLVAFVVETFVHLKAEDKRAVIVQTGSKLIDLLAQTLVFTQGISLCISIAGLWRLLCVL